MPIRENRAYSAEDEAKKGIPMNLMSAELTEKQFRKISRLIYHLCGINLKEGKQALVRARLMKRLRALKFADFDEYMKYLDGEQGTRELSYLIDVMTTNKTSFFREPEHFRYLSEHILPKLSARKLRFWTAACSSGEEPFSLAILLREHLPDVNMRDVKILATDISTKMLEKARNAVYSEENVRDVPSLYLRKYFQPERHDGSFYRLRDDVRSMVRLGWLNLMDNWPMKGLQCDFLPQCYDLF
ncbi:MAG: protein-glutamate O-methyltransferase CheR [Desulfobacterales bacterium]